MELHITKDCYLRLGIHTTEDKEFEILYNEFFIASNLRGVKLTYYDIVGGSIDYDFKDHIECLKLPEDSYYELFIKFQVHHTKAWTDCGYEYDSEIEVLELDHKDMDIETVLDYKENIEQ